METLSFLKTILAEIASDEQRLAEKRLVAKFLQERLKTEEASAKAAYSTEEVMRMPAHAGVGHGATPHEGFSEQVLRAVEELYHREFTVSDVFSIMVEKGVQFNSSTPKASISTALGRLVNTGLLRLAHKGAGKTPHRFIKATNLAEDNFGKEG